MIEHKPTHLWLWIAETEDLTPPHRLPYGHFTGLHPISQWLLAVALHQHLRKVRALAVNLARIVAGVSVFHVFLGVSAEKHPMGMACELQTEVWTRFQRHPSWALLDASAHFFQVRGFMCFVGGGTEYAKLRHPAKVLKEKPRGSQTS